MQVQKQVQTPVPPPLKKALNNNKKTLQIMGIEVGEEDI
jgi:hypothetical protein